MLRKPRNRSSVLLVLPALLIGCAQTPPPAQTVQVPLAVDKLCESWRHKVIRKDDKLTEPTAAMLEGDNKARPEWGCEYGQNRIASK